MEKQPHFSPQLPERIVSVDFFRGLTMFLLAGESTRLYSHLLQNSNPVLHFIGNQMHHHEWQGLHFWDLIQPFFMFIVGVALPFAVANRLKKGETRHQVTRHVIIRSLTLLLIGWALYMTAAGTLVFRFQNVLAQLSVTYLAAFLVMNRSFRFQAIFTLLILLVIDLAYRFFPVEGFNNPWVNYQNLGAWFNNKIEGVEKASEWATLNFVSTTAHTVWGAMCGKLLMSERTPSVKIRILLAAGVASLAAGYALDLLNITPIIKKIATTSFVFASGGWTILALCLCYWIIDVRGLLPKASRFFTIVGMNSIFIYLVFELGFTRVISNRIVNPFSKLLFSWSGETITAIITSLGAWAILWYICYWLYKNRVFVKI